MVRKERNELASQVERLRYLFNDLFSCHLNSDYREVERKIRSVLSEQPHTAINCGQAIRRGAKQLLEKNILET